MNYKIEKGVPLLGRKGHSSQYAFIKDMDSGDSFLAKHAEVATIRMYANRNKLKIATRTEGENVRIWKL